MREPSSGAVRARLGGRDVCFISTPRLNERRNVPLSMMKRVLVKLIDKRLFEKPGSAQSYGKEQEVEFRVFKVSNWPVAGTHKDKDLEENDKRDLCPLCKDTSSFVYVDKGDPSNGVFKCKHGRCHLTCPKYIPPSPRWN